MNHFTIKDIENLSGIKAHTLRIWEQRYGLCVPKRKESNHRFYDNDDLKHILRISSLYHRGIKASTIASFCQEEIKKLALECHSENCYETFINQLTEASLDFDKQRFENLISTLFLRLGFEKCILQVLYPFMEKIGLLWLTGHVIPAQEHFCSYLIQKKIIVAIDGLEVTVTKNNRRIIIFAPEQEEHEIPLLVTYYFLKKNGIPVIYFGKNTSVGTLEFYCRQQPVTHLYFHLITNLQQKEPKEYVECLAKKFPDKIIVAAGPALQCVETTSANVKMLRSMEEVITFAQET